VTAAPGVAYAKRIRLRAPNDGIGRFRRMPGWGLPPQQRLGEPDPKPMRDVPKAGLIARLPLAWVREVPVLGIGACRGRHVALPSNPESTNRRQLPEARSGTGLRFVTPILGPPKAGRKHPSGGTGPRIVPGVPTGGIASGDPGRPITRWRRVGTRGRPGPNGKRAASTTWAPSLHG